MYEGGERLTKSRAYEAIHMAVPRTTAAESEPQYEAILEAESPYAEVDNDINRDVSLMTNTAYEQIPNKREKENRGQHTEITTSC